MQKFKALYEAPLAQFFVNSFQARDHMSHGMAQSLQLPYTVKEAWSKYRKLKNLCKKEWEIDNNEHADQMKLCISILELGKFFTDLKKWL